ncbi:apolipoprotein D-like [Microplitis mediator]|uniref:apolipoprotein D-like n=1 Tax=Microplitis mediator TaxID=375433 RepID=UPI0025549439|nr:apolipoprotein D-like [Microplitis mediator]
MFLNLIIFFLLAETFIQVAKADRCPTPQVEFVDLDKYAGVWYHYAQSSNKFENTGKYSKFEWSKPNEGGNSTVIITEISKVTCEESKVPAIGYNEGDKVINEVYVPIVGTIRTDPWVLATDYENYSIFYACKNVGDKQEINAGIFTRSPCPYLNIFLIAKRVYDFYSIEMPKMIRVEQECD